MPAAGRGYGQSQPAGVVRRENHDNGAAGRCCCGIGGNDITREEAALILDPETSLDALLPYESQEERIAVCEEACRLGAAALREQEEREKPLTLDELRKMDGEPVFLEDLVHKSDPETPNLWGGWIVFTSHNTNGFIPRGGGFFSNYGYGKTWLAYRSKPKEDAT